MKKFYFWQADAIVPGKPTKFEMSGIIFRWFWQSKMTMRKEIIDFVQLELTQTCTIAASYESKVLVTELRPL